MQIRISWFRRAVWALALLLLVWTSLAYVQPDYRNVPLTLARDYLSPVFADVALVLGEGDNAPPTVLNITASLDFVEFGGIQTIVAEGVKDEEEDALSLVCCMDGKGECTPSAETNICTGESYLNVSPDNYPGISCNYAADSGFQREFVRCALFDGRGYSVPVQQDSYTVSFNYALQLHRGWNLVSLPVEPFELYNATGLAERIGADTGMAVGAVAMFDPATQQMAQCDIGVPFDSDCDWEIGGGKSYFVWMEEAALWTIGGLPWGGSP